MADHFQKPSSGVVVMRVRFKVFLQVVDSFGQYSDLYFRGTSVGFVQTVVSDNCIFFFFSAFILYHKNTCFITLFSRKSEMFLPVSSRKPKMFLTVSSRKSEMFLTVSSRKSEMLYFIEFFEY